MVTYRAEIEKGPGRWDWIHALADPSHYTAVLTLMGGCLLPVELMMLENVAGAAKWLFGGRVCHSPALGSNWAKMRVSGLYQLATTTGYIMFHGKVPIEVSRVSVELSGSTVLWTAAFRIYNKLNVVSQTPEDAYWLAISQLSAAGFTFSPDVYRLVNLREQSSD